MFALKDTKRIIREIQEDLENAFSFARTIAYLFEDHFVVPKDHFVMHDIMVYGAHRVGQKRLEGESC